MTSAPLADRPDRRLLVAAACVVVAAVALRLPMLDAPRFWLDEMISISIAKEGVLESVIATLRFSSHPPAYYTQLAVWLLPGDGDLWIQLNPILWSLAGVGLMLWLAGRQLGVAAAVVAAALLATLPRGVFLAANVRMYTMMHAFAIVAWYLTERYFAADAAPRRPRLLLAGLAGCQLAIGYAHGIGPVLAACLGLHGLLCAAQHRPPARRVWVWFAVQAAVGLALLPVMANGLMRETQHEPASSILDIGDDLADMLFHYVYQVGDTWHWLLPTVGIVAAAVAAAMQPRLRAMAIALVVVPIAASLLLALLGAPLPGSRGLSVVLPFFCLAAAGQLVALCRGGTLRRRLAIGGTALVVAWALATGIAQVVVWEKASDFRGAAAELGTRAEPGDVIVVPQNGAIYWGLARELIGPDWGSMMTVQEPPNERWEAMFDRLGPALVERLRLRPETDTVDWRGHPVSVGLQAVRPAAPGRRLWLVTYHDWDNAAYRAALAAKGWQPQDESDHRGVLVFLYAPG